MAQGRSRPGKGASPGHGQGKITAFLKQVRAGDLTLRAFALEDRMWWGQAYFLQSVIACKGKACCDMSLG